MAEGPSSPPSRAHSPPPPPSSWPLINTIWHTGAEWLQTLTTTLAHLTPAQRIGAAAGSATLLLLALVMLVYSQRLLDWLGPVAHQWRAWTVAGPLLMVAIVAATAFPPLFGYSTASTVAGFVFGFPAGWPLAATGCVGGSLAAFLACRGLLGPRVDAWLGRDARFVALGQVLRREGLLYLTAVRFCPLPFSLSNGFLATIPTITPAAFALSTALSSPKLLVHVFIGSRLAILADEGSSMSASDKAINYLSMFFSGAVGFVVGLAIYRRTMSRAAELADESGHEIPETRSDSFSHSLAASNAGAAEQGSAGYHDADIPLLDPDDAAAVLWHADWQTQHGPTPYTDNAKAPTS